MNLFCCKIIQDACFMISFIWSRTLTDANGAAAAIHWSSQSAQLWKLNPVDDHKVDQDQEWRRHVWEFNETTMNQSIKQNKWNLDKDKIGPRSDRVKSCSQLLCQFLGARQEGTSMLGYHLEPRFGRLTADSADLCFVWSEIIGTILISLP